jgi:hypothetical protein
MKVSSDLFLQSNAILPIGGKDNYALATSYGLLYLQLKKQTELYDQFTPIVIE